MCITLLVCVQSLTAGFWMSCYAEFCVICIIMVRDVILFHNLSKWGHVEKEKLEEGPLRTSTYNFFHLDS